jgi:hypothetical protein
MPSPKQATKTAAQLYDDFIKLEWQDIFRKEVLVKLDNGSRYVPNGGSQGVSLLRKNVNALDEAVRIWSGIEESTETSAAGYDRIVDQAGIQYTWEWFLIDPRRPWADDVPALVRERIEADLARRDTNALDRARARAEAADRLADEQDDRLIARMNARLLGQGKPPLSEKQAESVRESRRQQRTSHL